MLISTVSATVWRCKNCKWSENNNKKHIFFEHNMKRLTLVETLSKFYLTTLIYDFEKTNPTHVSATSTIILITKNPSLPLFYFLYLPVSISCIKSTICILPEGIFCPSQSPCNKVTLECCPQPPKKTLPKHIYSTMLQILFGSRGINSTSYGSKLDDDYFYRKSIWQELVVSVIPEENQDKNESKNW